MTSNSPALAKEILKLTNGSPNRKGLPIYADHSWKRKEVRRIVPRTAKEKKLSIKLVIGFWYITQDSRPGRVTRWTALTSDHFWLRMWLKDPCGSNLILSTEVWLKWATHSLSTTTC